MQLSNSSFLLAVAALLALQQSTSSLVAEAPALVLLELERKEIGSHSLVQRVRVPVAKERVASCFSYEPEPQVAVASNDRLRLYRDGRMREMELPNELRPDGAMREPVALLVTQSEANLRVVGVSVDGHVVGTEAVNGRLRKPWTYESNRATLAVATLYGDTGDVRGLIMEGDGSLVALTIDGAVEWSLALSGAKHDIATHPLLSDRVVVAGGSLTAFSGGVQKLRSIFVTDDLLPGGRLYCTRVSIIATEEGLAGYVVGGVGAGHKPELVRLSPGHTEVWRRQMNSRITDVKVVRDQGNEQVILAATDSGAILALDLDGRELGEYQIQGGYAHELMTAVADGELMILATCVPK